MMFGIGFLLGAGSVMLVVLLSIIGEIREHRESIHKLQKKP